MTRPRGGLLQELFVAVVAHDSCSFQGMLSRRDHLRVLQKIGKQENKLELAQEQARFAGLIGREASDDDDRPE